MFITENHHSTIFLCYFLYQFCLGLQHAVMTKIWDTILSWFKLEEPYCFWWSSVNLYQSQFCTSSVTCCEKAGQQSGIYEICCAYSLTEILSLTYILSVCIWGQISMLHFCHSGAVQLVYMSVQMLHQVLSLLWAGMHLILS